MDAKTSDDLLKLWSDWLKVFFKYSGLKFDPFFLSRYWISMSQQFIQLIQKEFGFAGIGGAGFGGARFNHFIILKGHQKF